MFVSCFIPEYDAIFHAQKIAKRDCPFLLLPNFGRITRPHTPHFSALYTQNSTSAPLSRCPESRFLISHFTIWSIPFRLLGCPILPFGVSHFTIWGIPFCLLGYPISPFGVSHFTIWGIFSAHLRTMYSSIFGLSSSFSLQKFVCFFPFGSSCFFEIHLAG